MPRLLSLGLLAVLAVAGCKGKGDASAAPDPEALKAQQDLIARRDTLMQQRQSMETEVAKIADEIEAKKAKNEDVTELEKKQAELLAKIKGQDGDVTGLTTKIDQMMAQGGNAANLAAREASMGGREKSLATREEKVAAREEKLAAREAALALREKETCGTAAPMIIQSAPPKDGGSYGKSDVQPLLVKAKDLMRKKGILNADLPGGAQGLDDAATGAMAAKEWSKAYFAAQQLYAIVDGMKIDRLFIQGKMARMSKQVAASKFDEATNQQLLAALTEVTSKYNDANYAAANARLNALAQQLNK